MLTIDLWSVAQGIFPVYMQHDDSQKEVGGDGQGSAPIGKCYALTNLTLTIATTNYGHKLHSNPRILIW